MATKVERWQDSRGNLHDNEAAAVRADEIEQLANLMAAVGENFGEYDLDTIAAHLIDNFTMEPKNA